MNKVARAARIVSVLSTRCPRIGIRRRPTDVSSNTSSTRQERELHQTCFRMIQPVPVWQLARQLHVEARINFHQASEQVQRPVERATPRIRHYLEYRLLPASIRLARKW